LGDEIKQILFNSLEQQFESEINELDESSKRLEAALMRAIQVRWRSSMEASLNRQWELEESLENSWTGPNLGMGLSHASIHNHSWHLIGPRWVWVAKASKLQGENILR
jgi:Golgi nucleoside diphosphatase